MNRKPSGTPNNSCRKYAAFWMWVSPAQLPLSRKTCTNRVSTAFFDVYPFGVLLWS